MHFCFDILKESQETVALTCPNVKLQKPIAKCCPKGQAIKPHYVGSKESFDCSENTQEWKVHINGHLYDASELLDEGKLIYEPQGRSQVDHF